MTIVYFCDYSGRLGASTGTGSFYRRPIEPQLEVEKRHLIKWVCECWKRESLIDAIDSRLGEDYEIEDVEIVMKLGLLCSNIVPESRPTMEQVVSLLEQELTFA